MPISEDLCWRPLKVLVSSAYLLGGPRRLVEAFEVHCAPIVSQASQTLHKLSLNIHLVRLNRHRSHAFRERLIRV